MLCYVAVFLKYYPYLKEPIFLLNSDLAVTVCCHLSTHKFIHTFRIKINERISHTELHPFISSQSLWKEVMVGRELVILSLSVTLVD